VVRIAADADPDAMQAAARADEKVVAALAERQPKRVITVPGRLVNFVV
jgi:leucyl-tRNA synthetase